MCRCDTAAHCEHLSADKYAVCQFDYSAVCATPFLRKDVCCLSGTRKSEGKLTDPCCKQVANNILEGLTYSA